MHCDVLGSGSGCSSKLISPLFVPHPHLVRQVIWDFNYSWQLHYTSEQCSCTEAVMNGHMEKKEIKKGFVTYFVFVFIYYVK